VHTQHWTIAGLRQRHIIWDEEYSLELRSAYPDSAVVTADDVLLNLIFPPRVRFSLATKLSGIGGRSFKNFAVDCGVYLLCLLNEDTPGYDEIRSCVVQLREYIDRPTKVRAKDVRSLTGKPETASYPKSGTTFRERSVRSVCAHILGVVGRFSGRIQRVDPQKYDPFSPRDCAGIAGSWAAQTAGESCVMMAASLAAARVCLCDTESQGVPADLRPLLASWAGEHCSIMANQYRRTRLPDWTAFESHDFAHYVAEQNGSDLAAFVNCLPKDTVEAAQRAIAEAQKSAYITYMRTEVDAGKEAMAFVAERMIEYVYGNPKPWDVDDVSSPLVT